MYSALIPTQSTWVGGNAGDTAQNWIFNISVFLFIIIYELSHGPVCCVFLSDILFADWMGYCIATGWTLVILVALSTPYMMAAMARWTFFFFGVLMIGIVIVFFFLVKETKGKSKKENLKQYSRILTSQNISVSYTHLTLPTILLVQISVVAVSLKKKK
eukprot:TRINITY_DN7954_c0_g1_i4.p4 TRINITY_DN7954_c0_g1~~TRINITY_DN7954_c0_g1_i4.p4  ORF type:complete len:159 (-),score=30.71 TRINITY_DN7954_c0_g1_i4:105-581(-)